MFNDDQPGTLSAVPRIICIGDVHGDLKRVIDLLKSLHIIDENTQWIAEPSNTIVIQLGDQIDSVSRGTTKDWETMADTEVILFMDKLDRIARKSGGRVLSIIGNHEMMNVMSDFSYVSSKSMELSGGLQKREHMFRNGGPMAQLLSKRNIVIKIGNITFCHGGILPEHLDVVGDKIAIINRIAQKYLRKEPLSPYEATVFNIAILGNESILWTRKYFELLASGKQEELEHIIKEVNKRLQTNSIVVGHNTVNKITPSIGGSLWLIDAALSRSYDSKFNEVLEILHDDNPNRPTEFRVIHIDKHE
jgi:hypothetical protein